MNRPSELSYATQIESRLKIALATKVNTNTNVNNTHANLEAFRR